MATYPSLSFDPRAGEMPFFRAWMTHNAPPQITVVVYDKESSEDHWSGLNPDKIAKVVGIETGARKGALA